MTIGFLWLPGWSFGGEVFQPLRRLIPESPAGVTVDYSAAADEQQFYDAAVAGAQELRTKLDADAALVAVGWSLGGMLALRLAADGLVDGAVIVSAGARFVRPEQRGAASRIGWDARQLKRMRTALAAERDGVEANFRSIVLDGRLIGPPVSLTTRWTDTALDAGLQWLIHEDSNSLLPSIECPILIIHGADDSVCPSDVSASLLAAVPHAERLLLEGAGHAPIWSEPVLVSASIRRWLNDRLS